MPEEVGDDLTEIQYTVTVSVSVTARNPVEAAGFALDDLRDLNLGPWHLLVEDEQYNRTEVEME